ncbi:MAG: D-alanine--D-alanine ligase [Gammaproteobacteria bacterium]
MKTALLMGGESPEREVSLMSGAEVGAALRRLDVPFVRFDPAQAPLVELARMNVGRVFNILHGGGGENGEVQGALRAMKIRTTGSGVLASALAMDKHRAKIIFRASGINTPKWLVATSEADGDKALQKLGLPLFVKPVCGGSTTHCAKVSKADELAAAIADAASEGGAALVEEWIRGEEYTAAILGGRVLPLIKITPSGGLYDYHAKYVAEDTRFDCPCDLTAAAEQECAEIAMRCFRALGCASWGRVDFIMSGGVPVVLEVNTIPGMTSHSLVPTAAKAAGIGFDELVGRILEEAQ